ncbi:hypothetical protein HK097_010845 [Rhizophlyctis rosea]|uniref:Tyrosinase copper-binding domain-containing protein n=1 Tax=Rhizophlyctis rosea TaxID=64517 RepID=A0AAD5X2U5_9FUNG|nr:hypothetical protein HK097_010845 [Rhizophlyctis rosea]
MHIPTLTTLLPLLLLATTPNLTSAQSYSFNPKCTSAQRTRYEWRELSAAKQKAFIDAVVCLKKRPSKLKNVGSPNLYDDFVYVHWKAQNEAHGNAAFPPWHRVFLTAFEDALRSECKYTEALPYWDWSVDSQAPERSPVWKSFGGDGKGGKLADGPFAGWVGTFPTKHNVNRNFKTAAKVGKSSSGSMMAAHYSPAEIQFILNRGTYNDFRRTLETHPHNQVHNSVGGDMGNPMMSSNDPVFWLHHCNIDRLWAKWQATHPKVANTYSGPRLPGGTANDAKDTDDLKFSGFLKTWKVKDTYDTKKMCFVYSNSVKPPTITDKTLLQTFNKRDLQAPDQTGSPSNPLTPDPYDRTDKYNIRYHEPLDEDFLRNDMQYPDWLIAQIRKEEGHIRQFIDFVNAIDGYVSRSALCNYNETSGDPDYESQSDEDAEAEERVLDMLVEMAVRIIGEFGQVILENARNFLQDLGVDYRGWFDSLGGGGSYQVPEPYQQQQQQYQQPQYQQPQYQQPQYQQPQYQQPQYQQPQCQQPQYQPQYQAQYEQPEYEQEYEQPEYEQQYQQPTYQQPSYQQPQYQQPQYEQPQDEQQYQQPYRPSYHVPSYQPPSYQRPSYQTPAYQTPTYRTSVDQTPAYQTPAYQTPSYQSTISYKSYTTATYTYSTPSYQAPTYQTTPTYQEPTYETKSYVTPSYQTPTYQTVPSYKAPTYATTTPTYTKPEPTEPHIYHVPNYKIPQLPKGYSYHPTYPTNAYQVPSNDRSYQPSQQQYQPPQQQYQPPQQQYQRPAQPTGEPHEGYKPHPYHSYQTATSWTYGGEVKTIYETYATPTPTPTGGVTRVEPQRGVTVTEDVTSTTTLSITSLPGTTEATTTSSTTAPAPNTSSTTMTTVSTRTVTVTSSTLPDLSGSPIPSGPVPSGLIPSTTGTASSGASPTASPAPAAAASPSPAVHAAALHGGSGIIRNALVAALGE